MITSTSNGRIKRVIGLQSKAKQRKEEQAFVIEGPKLLMEAPLHLVKEAYFTERFYADYIKKDSRMEDKLSHLACEMVSDEVLKRMSDVKTPQGVVCVLKKEDQEIVNLLHREAEFPFYLIIEDLQDPGNLGTIFRTAEAAGVDGIIMNEGCADMYNPKTIRATMGSLFRVPFIYVAKLVPVLEKLEQWDIKIYASCIDGTKNYDAFDYIEGTAFLIGNEGTGLTDEIKKRASHQLVIPMAGEVESLNAATAAAVLMFEVAKQRNVKRFGG